MFNLSVCKSCSRVAEYGIATHKNTLIARYVTMRDHDHRIDHVESIRGAAFVGAHALVKGAIPDYAIAAGIPARVRRYRQGVDVHVRRESTE